MSYYAYTNLNHKDEYKVTAREVETGIIFANKYYCPCCSALFYFKSRSSNNKPAHFAKLPSSNHDEDCWVPYIDGISGEVSPENASLFDPESFFYVINSSKERVMNTNKMKNDRTKISNSSTIMHLNTIRNLYKFCLLYDSNYYIKKDLRIIDILVARKTSYYYREYAFGYKLIEASYSGYSDNAIFLIYPYYSKEPIFTVVLNFNDKKLFTKACQRLYNHTKEKPVLIYSKWNYKRGNNSKTYVRTTITNINQIVPL
ncbi:MAG: hypothetical protein ILA13_06555 [Eubacterium sp.]|nr:hypothetical protein [Eubacterium sp.]